MIINVIDTRNNWKCDRIQSCVAYLHFTPSEYDKKHLFTHLMVKYFCKRLIVKYQVSSSFNLFTIKKSLE